MWTNHWWNPSQRVRYCISLYWTGCVICEWITDETPHRESGTVLVCIGLGMLYVNESLMKPLTESQVRYYCVYWTGCVMWMNHWWNPSQRVRYRISLYWTGCVICERITDETSHRESGTVLLCVLDWVCYMNESLMKPLTESQVRYYCVYWTGCVICERITDETPHRESGTVLLFVLDWVCYMWMNHWWNPSQRVRYGITVCIGLGVLYVNESLMKPLTESQVRYYCVYWTGCVISERITDETPHRESGTVLLCVLDWVCYIWTNHWWNPSQRVRYRITVCIGLGVLCEWITDETPHRESGTVLLCVLDWVCYMWTNHWWNPSQRVRYGITVCIGLGVLYVNESLMKPLTESQVRYYCVYWTGCVICERITPETPHRESGTVLVCVLDWVCYMWTNHWWNPSQRVRYGITVCIGLGVLYVNDSLMKPLTESQVPYYCVYWTGCVICERFTDETPHRESGTVLLCVLDWVCYMWTNHWWNPSQRVRYHITVCIGLGVLYVNDSLMKPLTESQVPY